MRMGVSPKDPEPIDHFFGTNQFFDEVTKLVSGEVTSSTKDEAKRACIEDYPALSKQLSLLELQDGVIVRNILRARKLSLFLIDETGRLKLDLLTSLVAFMEENLFPIGPGREDDIPRQKHILSVLKQLKEDPMLVRKLESISPLLQSSTVREIIRQTLRLSAKDPIDISKVRQAVLCALLTYLRQSVGSCFATAPAILIQSEQLGLMIEDLKRLLETSSLERVVRGVSYSVPFNVKWGSGDWDKPFLVEKQTFLHLHPGLSFALDESGLLTSKKHAKRIAEARHVFALALQKILGDKTHTFTTAREIFTCILLGKFSLTKDKVAEMAQEEKLSWKEGAIFSKGTSSKEYYAYKKAMESAKLAFLSLSENPLLKCWEYTLASFAEAHEDFAQWNLFTSLGIGSDAQGGISACVETQLMKVLEELNQDLDQLREEYDIAASHVSYQRARLDRARTEEDAKWLKIELERLNGKLDLVEKDFRATEQKSQRVANLLPQLMEQYIKLFPRYFQEVYDPDMKDIQRQAIYDDSPAGFRLLFKFGRPHPDQWKLIYSKEQFISSLCDFFILTEHEIVHHEVFEGLDREVSQLITLIVQYIRTDEFLEQALYRVASQHGGSFVHDPMEHLDSLSAKPWAYVSGGSFNHMIQCYYGLEGAPTKKEKVIDGEIELLTFYVDLMKTSGGGFAQSIYQNPHKKILAYSPSHAFLFCPGISKVFHDACESDIFTYTHIRDAFISPRKKFATLWLDAGDREWILTKFAELFSPQLILPLREEFARMPQQVTAMELHERFERVQKRIPLPKGLNAARLDSILYESLPLRSTYQLEKDLSPIIEEVALSLEASAKEAQRVLREWIKSASYSAKWSSKQLQEVVSGIFCFINRKHFSKKPISQIVYSSFQKHSLAISEPMLFADSNWTRYLLGFVVSPGTAQLELWCLNFIGNEGFPLSFSWAPYLRESCGIPWGVFAKPQEYTWG